MTRSLPETTTTLDPVRARPDDHLHHVCALHDEDNDPLGLCEAGIGCRSLCGRDLTTYPYSDIPLAGEQPCMVCYQLNGEVESV